MLGQAAHGASSAGMTAVAPGRGQARRPPERAEGEARSEVAAVPPPVVDSLDRAAHLAVLHLAQLVWRPVVGESVRSGRTADYVRMNSA